MSRPSHFRNGAALRRKAASLLTVCAMLAAIAIPPWLALREARRQAYEVEAGIVLGYASDVLHRADETGRQVRAGIAALRGAGYTAPPAVRHSHNGRIAAFVHCFKRALKIRNWR